MLATARRLTNRPFLRFLLGGALNTIVTYAVFLGLSLVVHYSIAYTITYLVGMVLSYWLAGDLRVRYRIQPRVCASFPRGLRRSISIRTRRALSADRHSWHSELCGDPGGDRHRHPPEFHGATIRNDGRRLPAKLVLRALHDDQAAIVAKKRYRSADLVSRLQQAIAGRVRDEVDQMRGREHSLVLVAIETSVGSNHCRSMSSEISASGPASSCQIGFTFCNQSNAARKTVDCSPIRNRCRPASTRAPIRGTSRWGQAHDARRHRSGPRRTFHRQRETPTRRRQRTSPAPHRRLTDSAGWLGGSGSSTDRIRQC